MLQIPPSLQYFGTGSLGHEIGVGLGVAVGTGVPPPPPPPLPFPPEDPWFTPPHASVYGSKYEFGLLETPYRQLTSSEGS